jgi:hypothetical protein
MRPLAWIILAALLTTLLGGCLTPEEQEDQTNQRRYDAIVKQGQENINRNDQKMEWQNQ